MGNRSLPPGYLSGNDFATFNLLLFLDLDQSEVRGKEIIQVIYRKQ